MTANIPALVSLAALLTFGAGAARAEIDLPPLPPFGSAEKFALLKALGDERAIPAREAENIAVGDRLGVGPAPLSSTTVVTIASAMLEKLLRPHFEDANIPQPYGIEFYGAARTGFNITLPTGAYSADVEEFSYDEASGRFGADIVFRNSNDPSAAEERITIKGKAEEMAYVLSPTHDISRGDRITEKDVAQLSVPIRRHRDDDLNDAADAVGKVAKRRLREGSPIRARDLEEPTLVSRNGAIDIQYIAPFMMLRTTGKALEDGGMGDVVRARSDASGKIVQVMVTAENTAQLMTENK